MTLEEKFWQLYMIPGDLDNPAHDYSQGAFGLQIRSRDTTLMSRVTAASGARGGGGAGYSARQTQAGNIPPSAPYATQLRVGLE